MPHGRDIENKGLVEIIIFTYEGQKLDFADKNRIDRFVV
jgi:hypothetical protein